MKRLKTFVITVKVHPAVRRFIDNRYKKVNGAYNLSNGRHYYLVTNMLVHSSAAAPSRVPKKYGCFVPIKIMISEYDFYRYGWMTTPLQEYRFSKLILGEILDNACQRIALLKLVLDIPRRKCMLAIIDEELFERDEISYDYLRKYYQRKFQQKEIQMMSFINDLKEEI